MDREEAERVVEMYGQMEDVGCSCHINPPCGKCESMPSPEEYEEACLILNDNRERTG